MIFWNSLAFLMIQWMLAIWSLIPLPFLKPAWTSGSSQFTHCWPGLENFEHYFTRVWNECSCTVVWAFFGIAFLWDWNENWPFHFKTRWIRTDIFGSQVPVSHSRTQALSSSLMLSWLEGREMVSKNVSVVSCFPHCVLDSELNPS